MNAQVDRVAHAAAESFRAFANSAATVRAQLLRAVAAGIEQLGDALVECVQRETALPAARITGERARTCMQLRLFADLAERNDWIDERIDTADPGRTPPKPAVRSCLRPIGPVAIFAASNFPLAFSVAGGDTAAALAAGCTVVVKAHPAHPDTSQMVAHVIDAAVAQCGLPQGVFSLVSDTGHASGVALVQHAAIRAGAFTGSLQGGTALWRAAQQRDEPIPFFAEMGSINPVFILPRALKEKSEVLATGLHASMTLGVGQFCTQPGVVFLIDDDAGRAFAARLRALVEATSPGVMLSSTISGNYARAVAERRVTPGVTALAAAPGAELRDHDRQGCAALFSTDAPTFIAQALLGEEVFGPSSLLVMCGSPGDFVHCAQALRGQLTATVWASDIAHDVDADLLWTLEQKAGRIIFNGFPTGVEVGTAMMHGGPFPATTDSRYTSVGTRAIFRFVRPVAWQTPAT